MEVGREKIVLWKRERVIKEVCKGEKKERDLESEREREGEGKKSCKWV